MKAALPADIKRFDAILTAVQKAMTNLTHVPTSLCYEA